jgi:ribosome-binding ATPase YchF (GTP1/OBG family)
LGGLDPARDIETLELELIFGDLEFVEKRLERMEENIRRGKKPDESEKKLLLKCKDILMKETPLRDVGFTEEERKAMRPLQFSSTVPEAVAEHRGKRPQTDAAKDLHTSLTTRFPSLPVLTLCGKIEMEIAQLSPDEKKPFLDELGIDEPAQQIDSYLYNILGLISFRR